MVAFSYKTRVEFYQNDIFFTFFMHTVAIKTLILAENEAVQKSSLVNNVSIGKSRNCLITKYQDIGSAADTQTKYDFYFLIMMSL